MLEYNRSWVRNATRIKLLGLFNKVTNYYIYPKFKVARYFDFNAAYDKFEEDAKFINIGAGEFFYHPKWKNYDLYEDSLVKRIKHFHNYDLRLVEKNAFPEKNVEMFYSAHTFEHIPVKLIVKLVERIYESLKDGGVLRVVVPDADTILEAYDDKDFDFFIQYESWLKNRGAKEILIEDYLVQLIATPRCRYYNPEFRRYEPLRPEEIQDKRAVLSKEEFLDYLIDGLGENNPAGSDHLNWFDAHKLITLLKNAGFTRVYRSGFGKSKALAMRQVPLFDATLPSLSLYVEAIK